MSQFTAAPGYPAPPMPPMPANAAQYFAISIISRIVTVIGGLACLMGLVLVITGPVILAGEGPGRYMGREERTIVGASVLGVGLIVVLMSLVVILAGQLSRAVRDIAINTSNLRRLP